MVSTEANRQTFIQSMITFLQTYNFDGIDISWEYPGDPTRGGNPTDIENYAQLLQEIRDNFTSNNYTYALSITTPISYWLLKNYDLTRMYPLVDFMNVMAYDIHGVWDANITGEGAYVQSHTNLTEIEAALNIYFKNAVPPYKLVMGLGAYGRTFTLADHNCI